MSAEEHGHDELIHRIWKSITSSKPGGGEHLRQILKDIHGESPSGACDEPPTDGAVA